MPCVSYYVNTHLGSLGEVFFIGFVPPQRNLPDWSPAETCLSIGDGLSVYLSQFLDHREPRYFSNTPTDMASFTKAHGREAPALCVFASNIFMLPFSLHLRSISHLNAHHAQGPVGSGVMWERWGRSPGLRETRKCVGTPRGSPARFTVLWDPSPP